jgi:hypothetical protein
MLLMDASASVKVNRAATVSFKNCRGVCQGSLLAPNLFLFIAEVLNAMLKVEVKRGRVSGIMLPIENRQQTLAQYADDTSLTLLGKEQSIVRVIFTLECFCLGLGLVLN